jgi:hypothetical protein
MFVVPGPLAAQATAVGDKVTAVSRVTRRGAFNAKTTSGTIVVNGIVASHFADGEMGPVRRALAPWWYHIVDIASKVYSSLLQLV